MFEIEKGNYLVTGANGLMGTTALERLKNIPDVNITAIYHNAKPQIAANNISYMQGDLTDRIFCKEIVKDIDFILMFAGILSTAPIVAKNPVSHIIDNTIMTMQMLEAAYFSNVKKFIWLSSTTGYPEKTGELVEEDMFLGEPPKNYYAVGNMSRFLETQCKLYAEKLDSNMNVHILRPTNIYGEYETFDIEKSHFLPALVKKVVDGCSPIEVWGNGTAVRDLIYSDDVLDACLILMEQNEKFSCYNVGGGEVYSVNEILDIILKITQCTNINIVHNNSKPTSINQRIISTAKIKNELKFVAKTSIIEGISKVVAKYKEIRR